MVMVTKRIVVRSLSHISTSSAATLYEVGFNHFFKGNEMGQDLMYFKDTPHGIYARSFRRKASKKI